MAKREVLQEKKVVPHAALPKFCELIRVSTASQSDRGTPEVQRAALDRLRTSRPGTFVARLEVEGGISGATAIDARPDLQKLFELLAARSVDEVRLWALDRLTRTDSGIERAMIFGAIKDGGAKIVCCDGTTYDAGAEGERGATADLLYTIQAWMSAQERSKIKARTQAGKARAARSGKYSGFGLPFGVRWDDITQKFSVDPEQAVVVRRIYDEASMGRPVRKIAAGLNADGVVSYMGGRWGGASVLSVLRKPSYVSGALGVKVGGEQITHREAFEPFIPRGLAERVRLALEARRCRPGGRRTTKPALLRGLAICGRCGASVHVVSERASRPGLRYYRCASLHADSPDAARLKPCGAPWHKLEQVDEQVWAQLAATLTDKALLAKAVALTPSTTGTFEGEAQAASCREELKDLARREKKLVNDYLDKHLGDAAYDAARSKIETRRATLQNSLKVAEDALARSAVATDAADAILNLMREEQDRVLGMIEKADAPTAAGMRRNLLQTYDFDQRRRTVELLMPRGVGLGFYLRDSGRVEIRGVLEVPDKLIKGSATR
jgi:DNA invertase Pin-like site-specific DNA recombinase